MRRKALHMAAAILSMVCVVGTGVGPVGILPTAHAAGMLALDALVTTHQTSPGSSMTSPVFSTTSGGELLLAFMASDGPGSAKESFSAVTGGGLAWRPRQQTNAQSGTSEIWQAVAPVALTNVTVTATRASGAYLGSLTVATFSGANTTVDGATAGGHAASGAPSASLATTTPGSWVWGVGNDWDQALARTVGPNQTKLDEFVATGTGDTFWMQRQTAATPLSGTTVTINDTAPTMDQYNLALIEIPANPSTVPDLGITMSDSGNFALGQTGAYTIMATNVGGAPTSGTVTVTDTLPAGLTATSFGGSGWACVLAMLTCTRGDALAAGTSYAAITLTVTIASAAPAAVTNVATVSGGGETNTANDTASDTTPIATGNPTGITLIQSAVNGNESASGSLSVSFTSSNTQGHFLIVTGTAARPASTLTISDTLGNAYTQAAGPFTDTAQDVTENVWYVPVCKGGANTVMITPSTAAALEMHVSEWSGLANVSPVDQTAFATGTGTDVSSGPRTTTANGELIFGYGWVFNTAAAGAGFTPITGLNGDLTEYQVQTTASSIAATFTQTSGTWSALLASFKPAGTPVGWSVAGAVAGGAGASIVLSGPASATVTADDAGNYAFNGLSNGTYTVTPSEPGFAMAPASRTVVVNGANDGGINFTATPLPPVLAVSPSAISFTATAGGSNPAPATINVTNSGGGALQVAASGDSAWMNVAPTGGTAPLSVQVSASINGLAAGTYTGHVSVTAAGVQGSPAVITVTLTVSPYSGGGGTLAIDATVSSDSGSASSSVTSSSFNTSSSNELLLAFIATDSSSANMTVTSVTGAGLTWNLVQRTNTRGGTSEIWRAFAATALTSATVTAHLAQSVVSSLTVMSFTGVDTSGTNGSGAIGAIGGANALSGAPSASLTTTRNNSWVLGGGNDFDNAISRTVGGNQTLVHQDLAPVGDTYWVQRQKAATPASGTVVTISDSAPTSDQYNLSIVEVLPHP